ncbi:MAG TPA: LptF/LptG family permease [Anaerohalosphaeraceae bacterium]|nr:LptF/LptG family permease [Anaerohalosphaeraceae bacterium]
MRLLDRYIAKNFLVGYFISFFVLIGLCITLDLFVNIDEFVEQSGQSKGIMLRHILLYYGPQTALWFRHLAGMITVIAAVFSLARMTKNNELIAVMASGISLKRILAPILFLAVLLMGLQIADEEFLIPRLANDLTRGRDEISQPRRFSFWFISSPEGHLFCGREYNESTRTMKDAFVILRRQEPSSQRWTVIGQVEAERAVYDAHRKGWVLENGRRMNVLPEEGGQTSLTSVEKIDFLASGLMPEDIGLRRQEGYKSLLSLGQIEELLHYPGTRKTDLAELILQKHSRVVDPIMNLIMLMTALPVLIRRDPREIKSAIVISFTTTLGCFLTVFLCKLFATESFGGRVWPEVWVWAPVFLFLPVALLQIDSMKS